MKKIINKAKTDSEESTFVSWKSTTLKEMTNVRLEQGPATIFIRGPL